MNLGIDYGTTTTLISFSRENSLTPNSTLLNIGIGGGRLGYQRSSIPSLLTINKKYKFFIGYSAEKVAEEMPEGTISLTSLKRCLACDMKKENGQSVCWNPMNQQYCIGNQQFKIFDKIFSAHELVSVFIDELLKMVSPEIVGKKERLNRVGISIPAIFGYTPRHTIFDLLIKKFDGNTKINVINEPTAAIIACQDEMLKDDDGIYAILDIGGGTTDIVLYEKRWEDYFLFKPSGIKTAGDDMDIAMNKALNPGIDITYEAQREIQRAKEGLSFSENVKVFGRKLTRNDYMQIVKPKIGKIISELGKEIKKVFGFYNPFSRTGKELRFKTIYLSGGGARIPFLGDLIKQDTQIKAYDPDISIIKNKILYETYKEDLSIVVVALGTSREKGKIRDCVQFILPYSIRLLIGDKTVENLPIYTELPASFHISNRNNKKIKIIACDPNDPDKPVHDLTAELISDTGDEIKLDEFVNRSNYFDVFINKNNIMWVTATTLHSQPRHNFNLPWQGGIETTLFDKYRKQWRANDALHKRLKAHIETSPERRERISMVVAELLRIDPMDLRQKLHEDYVCDFFGIDQTTVFEDLLPLIQRRLIISESGYRPTTKLYQFVFWLRDNDPELIPLP